MGWWISPGVVKRWMSDAAHGWPLLCRGKQCGFCPEGAQFEVVGVVKTEKRSV
jgi:hypothetical protein